MVRTIALYGSLRQPTAPAGTARWYVQAIPFVGVCGRQQRPRGPATAVASTPDRPGAAGIDESFQIVDCAHIEFWSREGKNAGLRDTWSFRNAGDAPVESPRISPTTP
jgi:hypothetical protein